MEQILNDLKRTFMDTEKVEHYEEVRPGEYMIYCVDGKIYNLKVYNVDGFNLIRVK